MSVIFPVEHFQSRSYFRAWFSPNRNAVKKGIRSGKRGNSTGVLRNLAYSFPSAFLSTSIVAFLSFGNNSGSLARKSPISIFSRNDFVEIIVRLHRDSSTFRSCRILTVRSRVFLSPAHVNCGKNTVRRGSTKTSGTKQCRINIKSLLQWKCGTNVETYAKSVPTRTDCPRLVGIDEVRWKQRSATSQSLLTENL